MTSALMALLRTVWLYAFAGFGYVAVSAVFRPRQVGGHLWHDLPWLRKDTFGIGCFAASALAYLIIGLIDGRQPLWRSAGAGSDRSNTAIAAAAIALYGFAGWAYIACNAIAHPYTLPRPLTHLQAWPTESQFGVGSFAASAVAYFVLQLSRAGNAHR